MPGRNYGRRRGNYPRAVVTSIKNQVVGTVGTTAGNSSILVAKAVTAPSPTVTTDVSHGCIIKAIYAILDGCGLGGAGALNQMYMYMFKNPGANLTPPGPISVGSSNEKKFVFKTMSFMIMRIQDGPTPFHWEGWIKIPKRYQRMGTDDIISLEVANSSGLTGHFAHTFIYKWYR